jgi:hypothetical protein
MTELDWNALQNEAKSAGLLPDGSYTVSIVDADATKPSSTGKPMIKVKMRVTEGPQKDKPVWNQFVISPESPIALRIFFQHMAAFGLGTDYFATNPKTEDVAKALINRTAVIELGTRQWQGQDRNEVKAVSPSVTGGPIAPGTVTGPPNGGPSAPRSAAPVAAAGAPPVPPTQPF